MEQNVNDNNHHKLYNEPFINFKLASHSDVNCITSKMNCYASGQYCSGNKRCSNISLVNNWLNSHMNLSLSCLGHPMD